MSSLTESQRFASDVGWVALSRVLMGLTGLVILPALTRSYPAEIYGVWAQSLVTVELLSPVVNLRLAVATVRFLAAEEDSKERQRAFSAMLWPVLGVAFLAVAVSFMFRQELATLLFADPAYGSLVPLVFLWVSMEAIFLFSLSYFRARNRIRRLAVIKAAFAAAKMAIIVIMATGGYSLSWVLGAIVAVEAAFVALIIGTIAREIGFCRPSSKQVSRYLSFSAPQIPAGVLLWVIAGSPRYFITHLLDLSQAGVYTASYTLGHLIYFAVVPISFVLLPSVSRFWEQGDRAKTRDYFRRSTKLFLALAIPAAAGLFILSQPLLAILTTPEFMVGGSLVLLIAIGTVFYGVYEIDVFSVYLAERTKWLPAVIGVAAAASAGLNLALIPQIGITGAAVSIMVSLAVLAIMVRVWARRLVGSKIDLKFVLKVVLASAIMALCVRLMPTDSIGQLIGAVAAGAAVFAVALWLLRALSPRDRRLLRETLSGIGLWFLKRGEKE